MRLAFFLSTLAMSTFVFAACSDSETTDGAGGSGNTTTDGGSGGSVGDGGTGGSVGNGGSGGAMCLAFGTTCSAGDTCCDAAGETGQCFAFGMGDRCTIPCPANPADCPAGQGCNNQTPPVCKTE
jgi:hypothetical protein